MSFPSFASAEANILNSVVGGTTAVSDVLALPQGSLPFLPSGTFQAISNVVSSADSLAKSTGISSIVDSLSIPESLINASTIGAPQAIGFMGGSIPTYAPVMVGPAPNNVTPTVAQFLDAANAEYTLGGTPPGMTPFLVNGRQLGMTDEISGMSAKVWITDRHQVIIAYQGTTGGSNALLNPLAAVTQTIADVGIYAQTTPPAERDALAFAREVASYAASRGVAASNIFVTGHSLGGIEAEYVAQQTGLGGIGFEPTGIPKQLATPGNGSNFVDVVTYGDPVGNYSSDIKGEQPFAPVYAPGQSGALPHYGQVVMVGTPADQAQLTQAVASWNNPGLNQATVLASLAGLLAEYHLPAVQAHDLGVSLSPYSYIADAAGNTTGAVFPAAQDTIPQLLSAYAARSNTSVQPVIG